MSSDADGLSPFRTPRLELKETMLQLEIDIFKRPGKTLTQFANPPHPPPVFMAVIAFSDSTYVLRNFRADDLDGIIAQFGSVLESDSEELHEHFAEHKTWFRVREVSDEQFAFLMRTNPSESTPRS